MKRVIFPNDKGGVCILVPAPQAMEDGWTLEAIIAKDIPAGKPYKIVEHTSLPDRHFRDAWETDVTKFNDSNVPENEHIKINFDKAKQIAEKRRINAAVEEAAQLDPFDDIKKSQAKTKYDKIKNDILNAKNVDELKTIMIAENIP